MEQIDREQIRRDALRVLRVSEWTTGAVLPRPVSLARGCLALLTELEKAKRTIDRLRTEVQIVHEANERFEARLADDKRDIRAELEQAKRDLNNAMDAFNEVASTADHFEEALREIAESDIDHLGIARSALADWKPE